MSIYGLQVELKNLGIMIEEFEINQEINSAIHCFKETAKPIDSMLFKRIIEKLECQKQGANSLLDFFGKDKAEKISQEFKKSYEDFSKYFDSKSQNHEAIKNICGKIKANIALFNMQFNDEYNEIDKILIEVHQSFNGFYYFKNLLESSECNFDISNFNIHRLINSGIIMWLNNGRSRLFTFTSRF